MNQILETQDTPAQIEKLAAQRQIYSRAKAIYSLQVLGSICVPVILSVVSIFYPSVSAYSALYAVFFFMLDSVFLERSIKELKTKAAKIQELFDCEVLEIIRSPLKSPDDILLEEIQKNYEKHKKSEKKIKKLYGWYAQDTKEISDLPISIARLICQRESLWWDSELRKLFSQSLLISSIFIVIVLGLIAWFTERSVNQLVLILNGLLPLFRFALKQYLDNKETGEKLIKTVSFFYKTWERILTSQIDEQELIIISRQIQNEIYDSRAKNPLIPDFFYWFFKNKQESLAKEVTRKLITQAKNSNINLLK